MKQLERIRHLGRPAARSGLWGLALLALFPLAALAAPGPDEAADPAVLVRGAKAWSDNCLRCHRMRDPKDYRDDQWDPVIYHMRMRAGLTGQETRDILAFLKSSN